MTRVHTTRFSSVITGRRVGVLAAAFCFAGMVGCGVSGDPTSTTIKSLSGNAAGSSPMSAPPGMDLSQMPDPTAQMLSDLTSKLGLSADQQTQVQAILQDQQARLKPCTIPTNPSARLLCRPCRRPSSPGSDGHSGSASANEDSDGSG